MLLGRGLKSLLANGRMQYSVGLLYKSYRIIEQEYDAGFVQYSSVEPQPQRIPGWKEGKYATL